MQALPGQSTQLRLLHMPTAHALQQLRSLSQVAGVWCGMQEVSGDSIRKGSRQRMVHMHDLPHEVTTARGCTSSRSSSS
eukprot:3759151-Amphidinium_carterae.1